MGPSDGPVLSEEDLEALTSAVARVAEGMLRKIARDALPALIKPQIEQSLKAAVPGLVESAVLQEKALMKETVQDVTRQVLPGMVAPILDRLATEIVQEETRKFMGEAAKEIVEKAVWEIVPLLAEAEVKKEIERLTAEA